MRRSYSPLLAATLLAFGAACADSPSGAGRRSKKASTPACSEGDPPAPTERSPTWRS